MDFELICKEALMLAHSVIDNMGKKGIAEIHDSHVVDISTEADMAVSHTLKDFFIQKKIPAVLFDEESGRLELMSNPKYTIVFDDIDGTKNYHQGNELLPYCTLVCIFDSVEPKFEDALAAGIIEHNSGKVWLAVRGKGCYVNGVKVMASGKKELDEKTFMIIDLKTGAADIDKFLDIYPKCWVRDYGAAALHLAGVSNGVFDAYLTSVQKAHELGAGYLLIKEAGGHISDWNLKPLDKVEYDFNAKYKIIAAATKELGSKILAEIRQQP